MAFAFKGTCYASNTDLIAAVSAEFPILDASGIIYLTASPSIVASTLSIPTANKSFTANTSATRTNTQILQTCVSPSGFDPVYFSGVFILFFSAVVMLWFFAKNLGLILNAVKRF